MAIKVKKIGQYMYSSPDGHDNGYGYIIAIRTARLHRMARGWWSVRCYDHSGYMSKYSVIHETNERAARRAARQYCEGLV